jgi:uncharacterized protein YejL (UPF0352 family)
VDGCLEDSSNSLRLFVLGYMVINLMDT